jgi:hypothetical protein
MTTTFPTLWAVCKPCLPNAREEQRASIPIRPLVAPTEESDAEGSTEFEPRNFISRGNDAITYDIRALARRMTQPRFRLEPMRFVVVANGTLGTAEDFSCKDLSSIKMVLDVQYLAS